MMAPPMCVHYGRQCSATMPCWCRPEVSVFRWLDPRRLFLSMILPGASLFLPSAVSFQRPGNAAKRVAAVAGTFPLRGDDVMKKILVMFLVITPAIGAAQQSKSPVADV